jgi:hypothetical protein
LVIIDLISSLECHYVPRFPHNETEYERLPRLSCLRRRLGSVTANGTHLERESVESQLGPAGPFDQEILGSRKRDATAAQPLCNCQPLNLHPRVSDSGKPRFPDLSRAITDPYRAGKFGHFKIESIHFTRFFAQRVLAGLLGN